MTKTSGIYLAEIEIHEEKPRIAMSLFVRRRVGFGLLGSIRQS